MVKDFRKGASLAVLSYCIWGALPLFWKMLSAAAPMHILAFRIVGSLLFVSAILLHGKNFTFLRHFREQRERFYIICAALLVTFNWGLYIWTVNTGHAIWASLGYYINPLVSIAMGLVFFRERLSALQWAAFACTSAGVIALTVMSGELPAASLALALSFGAYGLVKKKMSAGALQGLGAETLAALPVAIALIFFPFGGILGGGTVSLFGTLPDLARYSAPLWLGLLLAGPATATPLLLFSESTRLIPLSALGFIQFLSPTFTLLIGVFVFKEHFSTVYLSAFSFVWLGVLLYSISMLKKRPAANH
ncbi:MAG: EamA family transporter RarD [Spirochaetaceae bacterium]|jgi:chloramphenicol-sensitive protein RarD|nr:EamA family transporter RarD [Spirochaetaceae bacterium]